MAVGQNFRDEDLKDKKTCKFCGAAIPKDAVICSVCGRQVEELKYQVNVETSVQQNKPVVKKTVVRKVAKNKWIAFTLCLLLGYFGIHKFYEGKVGMGVVYLITFGVCGLGWIFDCLILLTKPNPYYVELTV